MSTRARTRKSSATELGGSVFEAARLESGERSAGDERSELCYKGFAVVPGLLDLVEDVGLSPKSDHPRAVAACELVLEGLAAAKRISRSEELGYTRAKPERREPGFGKGGISFG